MQSNIRIVLVGAVRSSQVALDALVGEGMSPALVVTLPPQKAQRHSDYADLSPMADHNGIKVHYTANVNAPETIDAIKAVSPDYVFVVGWSQICRAEFLSLAKHGTIGYHPAPLPTNRGRAVIPWTILLGAKETGGSLFWLDDGVDSGPILKQMVFEVEPDETAYTLYEKHLPRLALMISEACDMIRAGNPRRVLQDSTRATYCAKRTADDGFIDWHLPAKDVWTLIRASGKPYPGAFTFYDGKKLTVWEADFAGTRPYTGLPGQVQAIGDGFALVQCGDGKHILLKSVQLESGDESTPGSVLKIHDKLGINLLDIYRAWREKA